jgi:hypothetical protein
VLFCKLIQGVGHGINCDSPVCLQMIEMIKRDPEPADLRSAIIRLIASNRESRT